MSTSQLQKCISCKGALAVFPSHHVLKMWGKVQNCDGKENAGGPIFFLEIRYFCANGDLFPQKKLLN